jgi:Putative zinc- or iron-chelating domain
MSKKAQRKRTAVLQQRCHKGLTELTRRADAREGTIPAWEQMGVLQQRIVLTVLGQDRTARAPCQIGAGTAQPVQAAIDSILADLPPRACRPGCAWCCQIAVAVSGYEALWIADTLWQRLSPAELDEVRTRLRDQAARIANLPWEQHEQAHLPCALLTAEGTCGVYEARPLACRHWTSPDAARCQAAAAQPFTLGVEQVLPLRDVVALSIVAIGAALAHAGVSAAYFELHSAVSCALETPHAAERWARGELIFAGCKRAQHMNDTLSETFDVLKAAQRGTFPHKEDR